MSPQAFSAGIALLEEIYPKSLSEGASGVYNDICGHLSDDVWIAAIKRVCGTSKFFPVPAEILTAAAEVVTTAYGLNTPAEAWQSVIGVARHWGPGMSVRDRFPAEVFTTLQSIGGIRAVALAEDGVEIARIERQFRETYQREIERTTGPLTAAPLPESERLLSIGGPR